MRTTQGRNEKDIVTLLTDRLNRWLLGGGHQCAMSWASWAHERACAYMWNLRWINLKDSFPLKFQFSTLISTRQRSTNVHPT